MEKKETILCVDDELEILHALRRDFRHAPFDVFYASSAKEALEILQREEIDLLITDMVMPEIDGHDLLSEVKEKFPGVTCVILSGYTESEAAYKALAKGLAKAFFNKPWEKETLLSYVGQILTIKESLQDSRLRDIVNSASYLPTLPERHQRVLSLIAEDQDMQRIAEVIEEDPSLTSAVLKLANSVFYAQRRPVTSVQRALVVLGLNALREAIISIAVFESLRGGSFVREAFERATLCNRFVAYLHKELFGEGLPEAYSVAGLLHDIGRLFILVQLPEEEKRIGEKVNSGGDLLQAEESVLGISHARLGGYLLNLWNLPYPVIEVAMYHHDPLAPGLLNRRMVSLVHVGDACILEHQGGSPPYPLLPGALKLLGITKERAMEKLEDFFKGL